ncbi:MAG: hypothetical protein HC936_05860 [Leptolyngbyaceae cyanobacterium SU_3_3]|nr:hypothetical protein [Leptolyngbyaceae cyanobacterium SU_3_3]
MFRSKDEGETWTAIGTGSIRVQSTATEQLETVNTGVPNTVVRALLMYTADVGLGTGMLVSAEVVRFAESSIQGNQTRFRSELVAGEEITIAGQTRTITEITSDTELKVTPSIANLNNPTSFAIPQRHFLFIGTDNGVYRSFDQGQNWYAQGLATASVRALLQVVVQQKATGTLRSDSQELTKVKGEGTQFVDRSNVGQVIIIEQEIESKISGQQPTKILTTHTIVAIEAQENQQTLTIAPALVATLKKPEFDTLTIYLYAGTDQGVFCSTDHGAHWQLKNQNLPQNITCLAALTLNGVTSLFAGTNDAGVYRSQNQGDAWQRIWSASTQEITSLVVRGTSLFAGTIDKLGGKVLCRMMRAIAGKKLIQGRSQQMLHR